MRDYRDDWAELEPTGSKRGAEKDEGVSRGVIIRDLAIFQLKLFLDGFVDVVLAPLSLAAAAIEVCFGRRKRGRLFYAIMRLGEKADLWLNLYGASHRADADGLFGGSKAGTKTLLGELEMKLRGGDEPRHRRGKRP